MLSQHNIWVEIYEHAEYHIYNEFIIIAYIYVLQKCRPSERGNSRPRPFRGSSNQFRAILCQYRVQYRHHYRQILKIGTGKNAAKIKPGEIRAEMSI